jgi:hypothetical protein
VYILPKIEEIILYGSTTSVTGSDTPSMDDIGYAIFLEFGPLAILQT